MLKKLLFTACTEAIVLSVAAMIDQEFLAINAVWIALAATAALLVVAVYEWWAHRKSTPDSGQELAQPSHGPQSPSYGNVQGGVHNYFVPNPPALPSEPAHMSRPRGYARIDAMRRCPEMPISRALAYLVSLGRSRDEARRTLQQAFRDQRMEVWGRAEIRPSHLSAPFSAQETWERVTPHYWTEFKLAAAAFDTDDDQPQTVAQDHVTKRLLRRYWSLRVSGEQLKEEWSPPRPPEKQDDGDNWKTV